MQYFKDSEDLLALFEIDAAKPGAEDFCVCTELYGLMSRFPQYRVTVADLAKLRMKERGVSPLVFWSRMKKAIKPLLDTDAETFRALGVPCGWDSMGHKKTCPEIIGSVGAYVGTFLEDHDGDNAATAALIAKRCGRSK